MMELFVQTIYKFAMMEIVISLVLVVAKNKGVSSLSCLMIKICDETYFSNNEPFHLQDKHFVVSSNCMLREINGSFDHLDMNVIRF
jgi:hypothetical protein